MQWKGLRLPLVIAVLLVMLIVLFGGQHLYKKITVNKPLQETYKQIASIKDYQINNEDHSYNIEIEFKENTDLKTAYQEVVKKTKVILEDGDYNIVVKEKANKDLNQILYKGQFAVYEAIALGNYTEMYQTVSVQADSLNVDSKIYIDDHYIYLHLTQDDDYVFRVFEKSYDQINYPLLAGGGKSIAQGN